MRMGNETLFMDEIDIYIYEIIYNWMKCDYVNGPIFWIKISMEVNYIVHG